MAKVTGPLFSMSARGSVGKTLTYAVWRGIAYAREWFIPANPQSVGQVNIRAAVDIASNAWANVLTAPQRTAYDTGASGQPFSGFNLWMKQALDDYMASLGIAVTPAAVTQTGDYPSETITWTS